MSKSLKFSLLMAVAAFGVTAPLAAQTPSGVSVAAPGVTAPLTAQTRSGVSVADLDAAVAERPSAIREAVGAFLATDQAQEFAHGMGMTVTELSAKVASLDDESLKGFAEQAGISDKALAGGAETIVITATTAIIILLIIILLVK